jgi:DNA polymerase-3 subunit beta
MHLMADGRSHQITLQVKEDETVITAQSQEEGEGTEVVSSALTGDQVAIGFNAQYLQDVLNVTSTEKIDFHYKDANTQAEFRPVGDQQPHRMTQIIMPMRIS